MAAIDISSNRFDGNLLDDNVLTQFQNLRYCNISHNSFDGMFPLVLGNLAVLSYLDVSYNNLFGQIPPDLGQAVQLEYLIMAGNSFEGSIPASLGHLRSLVNLDLSSNNLSGNIPEDIASIAGLQNLNLSFNKLEGEVPFFNNITTVSLVGNIGLCGGNLQQLHLQPCQHYLRKVGEVFKKSCRKHKKDGIDSLTQGYKRITHTELFKATEGFAESNLIGTGSFGDVYKAVLDENERKPVAVKVLKLLKNGATKSFTAECQVLRRVRHRNLLTVITSCSSLDYTKKDFKALVLEFMSNGSLDNWLHSGDRNGETTRVLNLAKRLEIALDYLHNGCETPIIHCDIKPSNILLDDHLVAHVGEFGLAKLLHGYFSGGESMSAALKGSIGYIARVWNGCSSLIAGGHIQLWNPFARADHRKKTD